MRNKKMNYWLQNFSRKFWILLAITAVLVLNTAAQAATFTVTRTDDRNMTCMSNVDCSLREAINASNGAAQSILRELWRNFDGH